MLISEYGGTDPAGRLNVVGGGIYVLGQGGLAAQGLAPGFTAPFAVVTTVAVPPELLGQECALELQLEDSAGDAVTLPGPAGEPQALRVGQAVAFDEPATAPGIPRRTLRPRTQWVLNFSGGLPLPLGQLYTWRVKIDMEWPLVG